jgi:hypothetical protein
MYCHSFKSFIVSLGGVLVSSTMAVAPTLASSPQVEYQDQAKLQPINKTITARNIELDIRSLVGFGTRHTRSETASDTRGIGAARSGIKQEFSTISAACGGGLKVYYHSGVAQGEKRIPDPAEVISVIAIEQDQTGPSRYVLMSGDIDSRVFDPMDFTSDSPGANDNTSGGAGTLENVVIDNYIFGAAGVSEDGFESPVLFPVAAGAFGE